MMAPDELEGKKCRQCEHYEAVNLDQGVCHRFPPAPLVMISQLGQPQVQFYFSMVNPKNHCGEFKYKGIIATA
jgi:hypothetical protein